MWSAEAQKFFELLKKALISHPVLVHWNCSLQFEAYCDDANSVWIDAVLAMWGSHIAYDSRILNAEERNYSIAERGCLAVIWALLLF